MRKDRNIDKGLFISNTLASLKFELNTTPFYVSKSADKPVSLQNNFVTRIRTLKKLWPIVGVDLVVFFYQEALKMFVFLDYHIMQYDTIPHHPLSFSETTKPTRLNQNVELRL